MHLLNVCFYGFFISLSCLFCLTNDSASCSGAKFWIGIHEPSFSGLVIGQSFQIQPSHWLKPTLLSSLILSWALLHIKIERVRGVWKCKCQNYDLNLLPPTKPPRQSCNEDSSGILGEGRWYWIHDFVVTFEEIHTQLVWVGPLHNGSKPIV